VGKQDYYLISVFLIMVQNTAELLPPTMILVFIFIAV